MTKIFKHELSRCETGSWPTGGNDATLTDLQARYFPNLNDVDISGLITADELGKVAIVSSFGAESAVLLHYIYSIRSGIPVLFLDTKKHFEETLEYRDTLTALLRLNLHVVEPNPDHLALEDPDGDLFMRDTNACCTIRKTFALQDALAPFDSWLSGRKRYQSASRANIPLIERDGAKIKLNPMAIWTKEGVDEYFKEHKLPSHPLEARGYPSIGCAPCTRPVAKGEGWRAGRWAFVPDKTECGIHLGPDGKVSRSPS